MEAASRLKNSLLTTETPNAPANTLNITNNDTVQSLMHTRSQISESELEDKARLFDNDDEIVQLSELTED